MTKKATEKENIINSCYAVKMELTECITDYDIFLKIWFQWVNLILDTGHLMMQFL